MSELNDELATLQPAEALLREAREYVLAYEMGADTDKGRPGAKNLLARIDAHRKESGHDR